MAVRSQFDFFLTVWFSSAVKLHYYGRRTISGKLLAIGFAVATRLLSNYFDLLLREIWMMRVANQQQKMMKVKMMARHGLVQRSATSPSVSNVLNNADARHDVRKTTQHAAEVIDFWVGCQHAAARHIMPYKTITVTFSWGICHLSVPSSVKFNNKD